MLSFKEYIAENVYKKPHEVFNKKQLTALHKHKDFQTYVHSYDHPIYVRTDHNGDYVMANAQQKHTMTVSMSKHGKIYGSTIRKKQESPENHNTAWKIIKTSGEV